MKSLIIASFTTFVFVSVAQAQSNTDPAHATCWAENAGWLNWHDAGTPTGASGAQVHATFLSGLVWSENVGWINLGDGDPGATGGIETQYANLAGADFGVNVDPGAHNLSGYAWSENAGWISFAGGASATPPNPARIDSSAGVCRLRGMAWSENLGWINLDDAIQFAGFVAGACPGNPGDMNCDGLKDGRDVAAFVQAVLDPGGYGAAYPLCSILNGDFNGNGQTTAADIPAMVACMVSGSCP